MGGGLGGARRAGAEVQLALYLCLSVVEPADILLAMPWRPGQQPNRSLETPYDDIPDHLRDPIHRWIQGSLSASRELTRHVGLTLRLPLPDVWSNHGSAVNQMMAEVYGDDEFALNLLELILVTNYPSADPTELATILDAGHSAYRLSDDLHGVETRVLPEVKEQVQTVVAAAEAAPGEHLTAAWNAAYGRTSDPEKAYGRSIQAVEAAMKPVVSPKDDGTTLTKMILVMRDAPTKWQFALEDERATVPPKAKAADGVQVVVDLMRLLAYGQKQRHGQTDKVELNSEEQARTAVLVAAMLVQFCTSGTLRRVGDS